MRNAMQLTGAIGYRLFCNRQMDRQIESGFGLSDSAAAGASERLIATALPTPYMLHIHEK